MKIIAETEKKKGEIDEEIQVLIGLVQKGQKNSSAGNTAEEMIVKCCNSLKK